MTHAHKKVDPVSLQVYRHLLCAIPEEMGVRLRLSAYSPNIKERLDHSCALTGPDGRMVAQASHIPVHLGSAHITAQHLMSEIAMSPGDVIILNDPWRGGTHLPDITMFAPVFVKRRKQPLMGVLVRAHHADVGGATAGSMGPARDVHGEGLVIPPVKLLQGGTWNDDVLAMVLANTRTPEERLGDLRAQVAAIQLGLERVEDLIRREGARVIEQAIDALEDHARRATRALIRSFCDTEGRGVAALDVPGRPIIRVSVRKKGARLVVDFDGTSSEIPAPFNANEAITLSCVFFVVRVLLDADLPTNSGCLDPIKVVLPEGSLVHARRPAPVAGGNVETSQRIVDALLGAFASLVPGGLPAESQGTMNNLTVGGRHPDGRPWTFYETLGGGAGGGPGGPGESGIQVGMTNTLNTPIEALEHAFPLRVTRYHLRKGSGGEGRHPGGDGLVREFEFLEPVDVSILAGRRKIGPAGRAGGKPGRPGRDRLSTKGRWRICKPEQVAHLGPHDRVRIETPGGGGFGRKVRRSKGNAR